MNNITGFQEPFCDFISLFLPVNASLYGFCSYNSLLRTLKPLYNFQPPGSSSSTMATFLRRPGNLSRYSRRAADYFYRSRPLYLYRSHPQFASLLNNARVRSYATVNPGDPKPPNDKDGQNNKAGASGSSPGPSGGGNGGPKESNDKWSQLSEEEQKQVEDLMNFMKERMPASHRQTMEDMKTIFKKEGVPSELREFLQKVKSQVESGKPMSLGDFLTLSRLAMKYSNTISAKMEEIRRQKEEEEQQPQQRHRREREQQRKQEQEQQKQQQQRQGKDQFPKPPNFRVFEFRLDPGNFLISAFLAYYIYRSIFPAENSKEITWQEFRTNFLDKGLVEKLTVINRNKVRVDLHRDAVASVYPDSPAAQPNFHYYFSIGSVEAFERKLDDAQNELGIPSPERIPIAYVEEVPWLATLLSFGPTLLLIGSFFWLSRRAGAGAGQSGIFGIGKSRAKRFNHETDVKIRFSDVAGMDEAKMEIMEFVSFLKQPEQFQKLGAKIPRGAILSGPPGTGKTLLAKATAGESGVPFFSVSGSEFVEMFVGVGPSRVRDLFANARKNTPCIIFIDEIDAIGKSRAKQSFGGGNDERESTLNQILTEMDGFNTSDQVVVLAGTNRPDVLDKALMRPGRFDRHIVIDRPTMEGRKQIFGVHLKKIVTKEDMEYLKGRLAALTPGFAGADIANCVNEAALVGMLYSLLPFLDFELVTDTDEFPSGS